MGRRFLVRRSASQQATTVQPPSARLARKLLSGFSISDPAVQRFKLTARRRVSVREACDAVVPLYREVRARCALRTRLVNCIKRCISVSVTRDETVPTRPRETARTRRRSTDRLAPRGRARSGHSPGHGTVCVPYKLQRPGLYSITEVVRSNAVVGRATRGAPLYIDSNTRLQRVGTALVRLT